MTKDSDVSGVIAGYLDVKAPAHARSRGKTGKRRRFGPWKSWRRHWVVARAGTAAAPNADDGADSTAPVQQVHVELVLSTSRLSKDSAVVRIPAGATMCRTTSRSREFAFVVAAPATALHQSRGSVHGQQEGDVYADVYLSARSEADTERWIAALRAMLTPLDAAFKGLCVSHPRTPSGESHPVRRLRERDCTPYKSPVNAALLRGRRLSRSEGDLLVSAQVEDEDEDAQVQGALDGSRTLARARPQARTGVGLAHLGLGPLRLLHMHGRRRAETLRVDSLTPTPPSASASALSLLGGKIASGLISAGLGLMLSTPGGSEVEDNDEDADGVDVSDEEEVGSGSANKFDRRRESGVSVASGIYEEIKDTSEVEQPNNREGCDSLYENAVLATSDGHYEDPALLFWPGTGRGSEGEAEAGLPRAPRPPPLPPRQNLTPLTEMITRVCAKHCQSPPSASTFADVLDGEYVPMGHFAIQSNSVQIMAVSLNKTEPDYLPMSPARPNGQETQSSKL